MTMENGEMSSIHYLNTDLDIESENDLTAIIEAFGEDVIVMYHGKRHSFNIAHFELATHYNDVNETIEHFCDLVENLNGNERAAWDSCCARILDIGYDCGSFPYNYSSEIRADTMKRIYNYRSEIRPDTMERLSNIGASLVITIYAPFREAKEK